MEIVKDSGEKDGYFFKKRLTLLFSLVNVLVLVVVGFFLVSTGKILQGEEKDRPQISVSGEGKVFATPDIAMFMVTIITSEKRIGEAQNNNSSRSNAVVDFLKQNGIEEKDIKTTNYSVQPQYQYGDVIRCLRYPCPQPPPQIVSYEVRHSLQVKVRDLNKVDDLLAGVVNAGGNEVGSVSFTIDDEKKVMAEARKKAIDNAKQKAEVLARDLGVHLKKIVGFSESGGGYPIYYAKMAGIGADSATSETPQVQPGEQEIRSNVTITYELR